MKLSTLILALAISVGLTACGQSPEPTKPVVVTNPGPSAADLEAKKAEQEKLTREKVDKEKQAAANRAMEEGVTLRLMRLPAMTAENSQELAEAVGNSRYLGAISAAAWHKVMRKDSATDDYATNEIEQRERLVSGFLVWVQQYPKVAEKILDGAVPVLRTKSDLIQEMRFMGKLLATPYNEKTFESLLICSQYKSSNSQEGCKEEADKFGVAYYEGRLHDNAAWMVQFLHRRHLNGGDKFAQWSQKQFLKLAK